MLSIAVVSTQMQNTKMGSSKPINKTNAKNKMAKSSLWHNFIT